MGLWHHRKKLVIKYNKRITVNNKGGKRVYLNKMNTKNNKTKTSFGTSLFLTNSSVKTVKPQSVFMPQNIKLRQNIGYSTKNGIITINDAGEYFISFFVSAANSGAFEEVIGISFNQTTPSNSIIISSYSAEKTKPQKTCSLIGCGIFTATSGSTYAFVNNSKTEITISPNNLAEANIAIFRIN